MGCQHARCGTDGGYDLPLPGSFLQEPDERLMLCHALYTPDPAGKQNHIDISVGHIGEQRVWLQAQSPSTGDQAVFQSGKDHLQTRPPQNIAGDHYLHVLKTIRYGDQHLYRRSHWRLAPLEKKHTTASPSTNREITWSWTMLVQNLSMLNAYQTK
jgi:hypothetical protein